MSGASFREVVVEDRSALARAVAERIAERSRGAQSDGDAPLTIAQLPFQDVRTSAPMPSAADASLHGTLLRIRWRGAGLAQLITGTKRSVRYSARRPSGHELAGPVEVSFLGFARHR